jgi:hypothetical protein
MPSVLVGAVNGDSPLNVTIGKTGFFDLVADSQTVLSEALPTQSSADMLPVLAGVKLVEYGVFASGAEGVFTPLQTNSREIEKMVLELVENHGVRRIVTIGPGHAHFSKRLVGLTNREVEIMESIDLDPMLTWFWGNQKENKLAIAN